MVITNDFILRIYMEGGTRMNKDIIKVTIPSAEQARKSLDEYDTERFDKVLFDQLLDDVSEAIIKAIKDGEYSAEFEFKAYMDDNKEARKYSNTALKTLLLTLQGLGYEIDYKTVATKRTERIKQGKLVIKW